MNRVTGERVEEVTLVEEEVEKGGRMRRRK